MEKPVHTREVSGHRDPLTRVTDDAQRNEIEHSTAEGEIKVILAVEREAMNLANYGGIRLGVIWA
jgi:hypothetical protein